MPAGVESRPFKRRLGGLWSTAHGSVLQFRPEVAADRAPGLGLSQCRFPEHQHPHCWGSWFFGWLFLSSALSAGWQARQPVGVGMLGARSVLDVYIVG